jgi:hypothetical protein
MTEPVASGHLFDVWPYTIPPADGLCGDCGVLVNVYMVRDDVWAAAGGVTGNDWSGRRVRFLCIPCLQHRLGRPLTKADLTDVPANRDLLGPPR